MSAHRHIMSPLSRQLRPVPTSVAALLAVFAVWGVSGCRPAPPHPCLESCAPQNSAPTLTSFPLAILPDSVLAAHETSRECLRIAIDQDGHPTAVEILCGTPPLDAIARDALLRSTWKPAMRNGVSTAEWDTLTLFGCGDSSACAACNPAGFRGNFVYYENPPALIAMPAPIYPPAAREAQLEATVKVQARIGLDGGVWCTRVTKSVNLLDSAAVDAVWHSTWHPAVNKKSPVVVWVEVPVKFSLSSPLPTASSPRLHRTRVRRVVARSSPACRAATAARARRVASPSRPRCALAAGRRQLARGVRPRPVHPRVSRVPNWPATSSLCPVGD